MCQFYDYSEENVQVTFDKDAERGVAGSYNGLIVFVDYNSGINVALGETWNCKVIRNWNPESKNYFAWPIEKVEREETEPEEPAVSEAIPGFTKASDSAEEIVSEGNGTLFSELFTEGRYSAYRSINGVFLELRADSCGDIPCVSNRICIEGLDCFISTGVGNALEYRLRGNSILIRLEA
jgi:hypothetical protein